ncbi:MAG TPA: hypothetical protein VK003_18750 [Oceanobacillus sp.]|nr:hypothetical protein [Oceanobacillus sp.]
MQAPDCKLFVEAEVSASDLISIVAYVLSKSPTRCEMEVLKNEEYDSKRRQLFPDGFLYFRYIIDLYMPDEPIKAQAKLVSQLLEYLWDSGFPAVAACAFEAQLPHHGGYKSRRVPWPPED